MNKKLKTGLIVLLSFTAVSGAMFGAMKFKDLFPEESKEELALKEYEPLDKQELDDNEGVLFPSKKDYTEDKNGKIVLSKANTLSLKEAFTPMSVANLQQQLIKMNNRLPKGMPIYLVLDTPGGDVHSGSRLIDDIKGLDREVKTITVFAASMGFFTAQSLGERLIVPSGILMAHRARIQGLEGQVPGEAVVRLNFILKTVEDLEKKACERIGLSHKVYREAVRDEYWVTGSRAVRQNLADRVVNVTCDKTLEGTYKQRLNLGFFQVDLIMSNCPTVTGFLGYEIANVDSLSPEELKKAESILNKEAKPYRNSLGN